MEVCGFTIVRNGIKFKYPFIQSINSLLPLVDKLVINVGNSEDDTYNFIDKLNNHKIEIIKREWDMSLRVGGKVLSVETNESLKHCKDKGVWGIYLQADEVIHEDDYSKLTSLLKKYKNSDNIDGFSFKYIHFEGNYNFVNPFRYRREVRVIRLNKNIISWGDAAGFRYDDGSKLKLVKTDLKIYHYGWVRSPEEMIKKRREFEKMYHDDAYIKSKYTNIDKYLYPNLDVCYKFRGTHPKVMQDRISSINWEINANRRLPLLLNPKVYKIILHKWGILKGDWNW